MTITRPRAEKTKHALVVYYAFELCFGHIAAGYVRRKQGDILTLLERLAFNLGHNVTKILSRPWRSQVLGEVL
jgi:hypothetical protein